jgi:hypothetical protein
MRNIPPALQAKLDSGVTTLCRCWLIERQDDAGDIIAIYDVKTGGAVLSAGRVRELREKTNVGIGVPIIELQVNRGATIKGHRLGNIGRVMALLWNPVHRGNAGRAAGA